MAPSTNHNVAAVTQVSATGELQQIQFQKRQQQQQQHQQQLHKQQQQRPHIAPATPPPMGASFLQDNEPLQNHKRYYKLKDLNRWAL